MTSIGSPSPFFLAGKKAHTVDRSLRFNAADSAYLTKNTAAGNRRKFTISVWIKRAKFASQQILVSTGDDGSNQGGLQFLSGDTINFFTGPATGSGNPYFQLTTTAVFRDPGAWYHIVAVYDTENSTQADRTRLYVNGERITSFVTEQQPSQDYDTFWNQNGKGISLGIYEPNNSGLPFGGYMAEINFIDGQAYDPSYFGETDALTGQWIPKKYTGSYGTNGFYLNFSDSSSLGADSSGNSNNFTPNNFSTTAGVGNDSLEDTPTNNFPVLNPLYNPVNSTLSEGNLLARGPDNFAGSTFLLPKSGKWYVEFSKYGNGVPQAISVTRANTAMTNYDGYLGLADMVQYVSNGELGNRSRGSTSDATNWENDADIVVAAAVDMDNGAVYFARANTWQNSGDPTSGSSKTGAIATDLLTDNNGDHIIAVHGYNGNINFGMYVNFGQRPFTYTPPTGYESLCSANLPDPTIKLPNKHFGTILYTGNGSSQTISDSNAVNFTPDWVWGKTRNTSAAHYLFDQVRGVNKYLDTQTDAETTNQTDLLTAFNSNGFTLGANAGSKQVNKNGNTYVAWNWNAGDTDGKTYTVTVVPDSGNKYRFDGFGTSAVTLDLAEGGTYIFDQSDASNATHPLRFYTAADKTGGEYTTGVTTAGTPGQAGAYTQIVVAASAPTLYYQCSAHANMGGQANTNSTLGSSNFDGSTQSTVKVNASAGFSITKYTGTGSTATVGHGLGVAPDVLIVKNRDDTNSWNVYHAGNAKSTPAEDFVIYLDQTSGKVNQSSNWNDTAPTSSVFTVGSSNGSNGSSDDMIAYCFSEVAGYSKFGSYTGNGSSNGPFVFTGFRASFLIIKNVDRSAPWYIFDIKRNPHNEALKTLRANSSNAEATDTTFLDILSNGFKIRNSGTFRNGNNETLIYLAFAESPFRNARAR